MGPKESEAVDSVIALKKGYPFWNQAQTSAPVAEDHGKILKEFVEEFTGWDMESKEEMAEEFNEKDLLATRSETHGSFDRVSRASQQLKGNIDRLLKEEDQSLRYHQEEALNMIVCKLARIICGDPNFEDHWLDIAGYAKLAVNPVQ